MHVMRTHHVFSRVREGHKQRKLLQMSMNISRNSTGVNGLKDLLKRTSDDTGVPCTSIKRLRKEKVDIGGAAFLTSTKRYRLSTVAL